MDSVQSDHGPQHGLNVVGYFSGTSGLGNVAKSVLTRLIDSGVPCACYDLEPNGQVSPFEARRKETLQALPYDINLYVVGLQTLHEWIDRFEGAFPLRDRLHVAICFWELPTIPPRWLPALERLDGIVATSDYMRVVFELAVSGTAIVAGSVPVVFPEVRTFDRVRLGLSPDQVVFCASFDPGSDPVRKNPLAVAEAFVKGVGTVERAALVFKINMSNVARFDVPVLRTYHERIAAHPRIKFVTEDLDYDEVLGLYASCDVYVSLHRAEGLGLGMLESMSLGKPVIATDWSGNMTFMNRRNACLVRHRLVPVEGLVSSFQTDKLDDHTTWADADVDEAGTWMRLLVDDPAMRSRIGDAARRDASAFVEEAMRLSFVDELMALRDNIRLLERKRSASAPIASTDARRQGRLARIQELERELNWIKGRPSYRIATKFRDIARRALRP